MQMALDALEHGLPIIEDFGGKEQLQLQHKAIAVLYEALRAALAQPPCATGAQCVGGKCERCAVQPEQEPWGYISHRSWKMPVFVEAENLEVSGLPFNNPNYTPVYKAPPQREWQGLTDEERKEIIRRQKDFWGPVGWELECVKAIEAKLKEKNGL